MATDGINLLRTMLERDADPAPVGSAVDADNGTTEATEETAAREARTVEDEASTQLSREQVEKLAETLSENANLSKIALQFRVDEDVDRIVVSVFDQNTEEIIRQVPPEEALNLARSLDQMVGLLFDKTA